MESIQPGFFVVAHLGQVTCLTINRWKHHQPMVREIHQNGGAIILLMSCRSQTKDEQIRWRNRKLDWWWFRNPKQPPGTYKTRLNCGDIYTRSTGERRISSTHPDEIGESFFHESVAQSRQVTDRSHVCCYVCGRLEISRTQNVGKKHDMDWVYTPKNQHETQKIASLVDVSPFPTLVIFWFPC